MRVAARMMGEQFHITLSKAQLPFLADSFTPIIHALYCLSCFPAKANCRSYI